MLNVKYSLEYSNPQSTLATKAIHQNQKPLKHQLHSKFNLTLASPHTILKTLNIHKIPKQFSLAPTNYLPIQSGLNINPFVLEGSFIMLCSLRGLPGAKGLMHIKCVHFLPAIYIRSLTSQTGAKNRSDYIRRKRLFPPSLA